MREMRGGVLVRQSETEPSFPLPRKEKRLVAEQQRVLTELANVYYTRADRVTE